MPDEVIPDPQTRKRELTRLRVQRHRERKVKHAAFVEALEAVAATEEGQKPSRARSKQALLQNVLAAEGVTVSRLVKKKVQALESTKLRQVGPQVVEVPDVASQLRACDALTKDLQLAGELPTDTQGTAPPVVVNVLFAKDADSPDALRRYNEDMRIATGGRHVAKALPEAVLTVESSAERGQA